MWFSHPRGREHMRPADTRISVSLLDQERTEMRPMPDEEGRALVERYRPRVIHELAELEALQAQTAENRAPVALDQQSLGRLSRMDALQNQAMAGASERRRAIHIARLRRTLARMEDGEFGLCTECGDRIPDGRLDADPSNHLCVSCAALRA
jgi:DnaK suppressor protein